MNCVKILADTCIVNLSIPIFQEGNFHGNAWHFKKKIFLGPMPEIVVKSMAITFFHGKSKPARWQLVAVFGMENRIFVQSL